MSKRKISTSDRRERDRIMHAQQYRGNFIRHRMMDLPEQCRARLPASEDEGTLLAAERAIRAECEADRRRAAGELHAPAAGLEPGSKSINGA